MCAGSEKAIMQMIHGRLEEGIRLLEGAERKVEEGGRQQKEDDKRCRSGLILSLVIGS